MKVRKRYLIRISGLQRTVWISRPSHVSCDYFSSFYDCDFKQAKTHLRLAKENGYYISKVK